MAKLGFENSEKIFVLLFISGGILNLVGHISQEIDTDFELKWIGMVGL